MLKSEIPLLYLRVVKVSVNGTEVSKVDLGGVELAYGCCCIRLNRRRSRNKVGVRVRASEAASQGDSLNEWWRKPEICDGVEKDEVMGDPVSATHDPLS